jgi:hypothetical protein
LKGNKTNTKGIYWRYSILEEKGYLVPQSGSGDTTWSGPGMVLLHGSELVTSPLCHSHYRILVIG